MSVLLSNETWDDNKSYRVKQSDGTWKKKSFLGKAKSILFGDGTDKTNNAEANLGAIKGITTSTNVTEEGYAIDATAVASIKKMSGDSIIRGTTKEESLYSKTVYIQKNGVNIASSTIDSAGQFSIGGIAEIGLLTATATDADRNIAIRNINVTAYSLYEIELNFAIIYAFHADGALTDPATIVTYLENAEGMTSAYMNYASGTFDYGDWKDAFFMPKPCMLKQAGIVDYYLNPDEYALKADGGASDITNTAYGGNAMME